MQPGEPRRRRNADSRSLSKEPAREYQQPKGDQVKGKQYGGSMPDKTVAVYQPVAFVPTIQSGWAGKQSARIKAVDNLVWGGTMP